MLRVAQWIWPQSPISSGMITVQLFDIKMRSKSTAHWDLLSPIRRLVSGHDYCCPKYPWLTAPLFSSKSQIPIAVPRSILAPICVTNTKLVMIKLRHNSIAFILVRFPPASYIWVDYISVYLHSK